MKKVLVVDENGRTMPELKKIFEENNIETVFENSNYLYENAEKPSILDVDGMIYFGNSPSFVKICFDTAVKCKINKAVLVGNMFSYFDRAYPDKKLAETHNFVHQANLCATEAVSHCDETIVSVAELPFIDGEWPMEFTTVNGAIGMNGGRFFLAPEGGTAEITAENAAKAIYAVLINGENGIKYPICDKCRKFKDILQAKVGEDKKVYEYPTEFDWVTVLLKKKELKKAQISARFNLKKLYSDFLSHNWYFDDSAVKKALNYGKLFENINKECNNDTIINK